MAAAVPSTGRAARVEKPVSQGSDATRDLYERFSGQIYGYCLHQLGSREEAEDAVQTTFMNAFRGLQRGIVPKIESAWLFKIAHNVCLSRRRSTRRRGKVEAPNNLEVLQEVVPARERMGDELIRLPDALEEMPENQRRAILLREWQGLSYREIADELELSQSAVETLIFRARRALAAGLEVEPERPSWRRRARHGVDAGGLLAALKALLTGSTALKVAATVAVATTAAVAVSGGHHRLVPRTRVPAALSSRAETRSTARTGMSLPVVVASTRAFRTVKQPAVVKPAPKSAARPVVPQSVPPAAESSESVPPPQVPQTAQGETKPANPPRAKHVASVTHDTPDRVQEQKPVTHDAKSAPQPLPPPPSSDAQSPSDQAGGGSHGSGNDPGHGNGHK